jgi:hypothetical protein
VSVKLSVRKKRGKTHQAKSSSRPRYNIETAAVSSIGPVMAHPTFYPPSRRSGPRAARSGPHSEDAVNSPARSPRGRGRGRSVTPLNTSGAKRYAPLPLECRETHTNHTAARSAWARKEQEALRRLGLRVVRTLIGFVLITTSVRLIFVPHVSFLQEGRNGY